MKRMSIAEQTLKKQAEAFQRQWDDLHAQQVRLTTEMEVLETCINDLKLEQERLRRQREESSEARSPRHHETPHAL